MFPLPLHNANSHRKRGRRFGNDSQADIFVQLPTPGQRREYSSDKRRFRGSIKAEMRRFLAKNQPSVPRFHGMEMPRLKSTPGDWGSAHHLASHLKTRDLAIYAASRWRAVSVGKLRFHAATDRKLTDRTLDVEVDPRHLREQLNIGDPDRASAQPHIVRHQVECLHQCADILENERIRDRAVLP